MNSDLPADLTRRDDPVRRAFVDSYRCVVDDAPPVDDPPWPPVAPVFIPAASEPRRRLLAVAVVALLISGAFAIGWLAAPERAVSTDAAMAPRAEESAVAQEVIAGPAGAIDPFPTATDAAIAAARLDSPDLSSPTVTKIVGIFAGETTVDLRVQVTADSYCQWFGVVGTITDDRIEWRGGEAIDARTTCQT